MNCRAHSSRTGQPCKRYAIRGATVCPTHGGSIKRVKQTAYERLAEMVDPLLTELFRIAQSGDSDQVRLAAIRDALDRAGYKPKERVDVTSNGQTLVKAVREEDLALLNGDR